MGTFTIREGGYTVFTDLDVLGPWAVWHSVVLYGTGYVGGWEGRLRLDLVNGPDAEEAVRRALRNRIEELPRSGP